MSRLDYCQYELVDDCYNWKTDNCDRCNIFKAYCEGARMAKASIVRCKDCRHAYYADNRVPNEKTWVCERFMNEEITSNDFCSWGERKGGDTE